MDMRSVYDSKEGIAIFLGTYEEFYELCLARRRMEDLSSKEGEKLGCFYVLGRFRLDELGNCMSVMQTRKTVQILSCGVMKPVMTEDEYLAMLNDAGAALPHLTLMQLRRPDIVCAGCGLGWTMENFHEAVPVQKSMGVSMEEHEGKTLGQLAKVFRSYTDAEHVISMFIQNLLRVNEPIAGFGWDDDGICDEHSDPPMTADYVIQPGDEGTVFVTDWFHPACHERRQAVYEKVQQSQATIAQFTEMFVEAGFDDVIVGKVPLPLHILEWLRHDMGEDFNSEAASASDELVYMQVRTAQGQLGISMISCPAFDLTGTGITPADLNPQLADFPSDMPPLVGFDGSPELFLRLWQLMTKRKSAIKAATPYYCVAVKRESRGQVTLDWIDRLCAIPGLTVITGDNPLRVRVTGDATAMEAVRQAFGDSCHIEPYIKRVQS